MLQLEISKKKRFKADMAPLIDVVFLLLIFFMLTFAIPGQGMSLNLPNESSTVVSNQSQLIVKINNSGFITVNDEVVALDVLIDKLSHELDQRSDKSVSIETANKTAYDLFVSVIDKARQAGAKEFSLIM
jgi:biopolymer transport protein ExbD